MTNFATFTKKSVGTLTLGERLKRLRSDRRISLVEVSRNIKVQMKYLESLENGDYDSLPADVYVRGFLKSFADFLGVDDKVLVRLYEKETGIRKNLEKGKDKKEEKIKPLNISSFTFTPKKAIFAVSCLLIALIVFFIYKEIGSFNSSPRLVIISPEANSETGEKMAVVEGITEKDVRLLINDQLTTVNDEGKFREEITLQPGGNTINVKAINKFDKETQETVNIQSNFQDEELENSSADQPTREDVSNSEKISLEVRVEPGPVWLNVEADGNLVFSGTLLAGALQNFEAKDKIVMSSAQASATFLRFNGKDIGTLGKDPGAVKNIIFDKNTKY